MPTFQYRARKTTPDEQKGVSSPRCNFYESPDDFIVTVEMPGVKKEALEVSFDAGILTIEGTITAQEATPYCTEYKRTKFVRELKVGDGIDVEAAKAELVDGVLTLRLPKAERAKARKISVL
jgi:HSP20 family molecular chaperone IbpA